MPLAPCGDSGDGRAPPLTTLVAVSASAACAARRAAAICALTALLGLAAAIASFSCARNGAPEPGSIRNSDPSIERIGAVEANCGARASGSLSARGSGADLAGAKTGASRIVASIEFSAALAGPEPAPPKIAAESGILAAPRGGVS